MAELDSTVWTRIAGPQAAFQGLWNGFSRALPVICVTIMCLSRADAAAGIDIQVLPDGTGQYPTIQAAIIAASDGMVIGLGDGVFEGVGNYDIDFFTKDIALVSISGDPSACIIDAKGTEVEPRRVFDLAAVPATARVEGITITGGYADVGGGMKLTYGSSLQIIRCVFRANFANEGGGAYCRNVGTRPHFIECTFDTNEAAIRGGGLDAHLDAEPTVLACTFWGNVSPRGASIGSRADSRTTVANSILAFGTQGHATFCEAGSTIEISCSNVFGHDSGNWTGCIAGQAGGSNIEADPLFCDPGIGNFGIDGSSPCTGFRSPCGQRMGAWPEACGLYGACCLGDGTCQIVPTEVDCFEGIFLGQGSPCDPLPCPQQLACCFDDGYCAFLLELACLDQGGSSLGQGSTCSPHPCGTITVYPDGSGNFPDIRSAVLTATSEGLIELADGVFTGAGNRNIDFAGKNILLRSQSGNAPSCVIDCEGRARAFVFASSEESATVAAVTVRNGFHTARGGAVQVANGATPTIEDCVFEGNSTNFEGAAIHVEGAGASLVRCTLRGNSAVAGSCVSVRNASASLETCTISGNGPASSIVCEWSTMSIVGSTIAANESGAVGGGIRVAGALGDSSWVVLDHSIVWGNCADDGAAIFLGDEFSRVSITCSAIDPSEIGGAGTVEYLGEQVETDPLFCEPIACTGAPTVGGDYRLMPGSPCLPEHSPCQELIGALGPGCEVVSVPGETATTRLRLGLPRPNPSSGAVTFWVELPESGSTRVQLLDVAGRNIETLHDAQMPAGHHEFVWEGRTHSGREVPNGIYYLKLSAMGTTLMRRLTMIR